MTADTSITDRALLEAAARAAGIEYTLHNEQLLVDFRGVGYRPWNPLTDDGDEARMEAVLGLDIVWSDDWVYVGGVREMYSDHNGDRQAARRWAGVRAAAEIGRNMP